MIHLLTLGAVDLRDGNGGEVRSVLAQPKRLALLVYLALAETRQFHRRERLLSLFWPELDESHARNSLSQALTTLRRGLGPGVLLKRGEEEVALASGSLQCDVFAFEAALSQGDRAEALDLYRGDFLDGFRLEGVAPELERWVEDERSRLRAAAARAALDLARESERREEIGRALEWARRASTISPSDEAALAARMRLLARSGDRTGALALHREFVRYLAEELGLEPSTELERLAEEIRQGAAEVTPDPARLPAAPTTPRDHRPAVTASDRSDFRPADGNTGRSAEPPGAAASRRVPERAARRSLLLAVALAAAVLAFVLRSDGVSGHLPMASAGSPGDTPSIAVLPFASLCGDSASHSLVGGLHSELVTQLSRVTALRVSTRASVERYAGERPSGKEIASELEVGALLEGTVQCEGDAIRVNVQLVDPASERNLWGERYDGDRGDLFAFQTAIAQAVAAELRGHLSPREQAALARRHTENDQAYEAYLQAQEYHERPVLTEADALAAERLYLRAIRLDPEFALAHARLSRLHGYFYLIGWDRNPARFSAWRSSAETALRLQPGLAEGRLARAGYLRGQGDHVAALAELDVALRQMDNSSDVHRFRGEVLCHLARWEECIAGYRRAIELEPRTASHHEQLGFVYWFVRRYPEAVAALDRALELAPDYHVAAIYRGRVFVDWLETTDSLSAALRRLPPDWDPDGIATTNRVILARLERRPLDALAALDSSRHDAFRQWRYEVPFSLLRGKAYADAGNPDAALTQFRAAVATLERMAREEPRSAMRHVMLGQAYAELGRRTEARREAALALDLQPMERGAIDAAAVLEHVAEVHATIGDIDTALREVETLLTVPSPITLARLRREARWDPLRGDPRFQRLLGEK